MLNKKIILGIPIVSVSIQQIHKIILTSISEKGKKAFFYVNAYCLVLASQNQKYKEILNRASIVYSGGIGPILASKILGRPIKERTPTPDFIDFIFESLQKNNQSIYLLGSTRESVKKAAGKINNKFPKLIISGYHSGYFSKTEEEEIIKEINRLKPTIIFVGMGPPMQELWIERNMDRLNAKVFWGVGAMFDVISGKLPRAPKWIQNLELEWFYRMLQEPKRLWQRYTLGILRFVYITLKDYYKINLKHSS